MISRGKLIPTDNGTAVEGEAANWTKSVLTESQVERNGFSPLLGTNRVKIVEKCI